MTHLVIPLVMCCVKYASFCLEKAHGSRKVTSTAITPSWLARFD